MKINYIRQIITWPRFWGPLATIAATGLYHAAATYFGFSVAVFPLAAFLALGSLFGLWSGLICAGWISAYAYFAIPGDLERVVQIWLGSFAMAVIIGSETRTLRAALVQLRAEQVRAERNEAAARVMGALNGNILRIQQARKKLLAVLQLRALEEPTRVDLREVLHTLNNLELATAGWRALDQLKAESATHTHYLALGLAGASPEDLRAAIEQVVKRDPGRLQVLAGVLMRVEDEVRDG